MTHRNPAARFLLLLCVAGVALGCSPYDKKLLSGGTGGGGTGGSGGMGGSGGTGGTGGTECTPTNGGVETCDRFDNDCNGVVNDGQAAASCRTMGILNAVSICTAGGQCVKRTCDVGFYDCNRNPGDGCEASEAEAPCGFCRVCDDAGEEDAGGEGGIPDADVVDGSADAATDACVPMGTEKCDGVDNDCDGMIDPGATCPSMCSGITLPNGKVYVLCQTPVNWGAARGACRNAALLMDLVRINDAGENADVRAFVTNVLGGTATAWIGANDNTTEGEWRWSENGMINGTQFWMGGVGGSVVGGLYENWAASQPDDAGGQEDCAEMTAAGEWNDLPCGLGASKPYVCE